MATVEANKTLITLAREDTYGAASGTALVPVIKLPDMMEYSFGNTQISVPQKTLTLEPKIKTSQSGRESPTVTLSGILTDTHMEFLIGFFGYVGTVDASTTTFVWQTSDVAADAVGHSYTISQCIPVAADDWGDGVQALGCRLETLEISKNGEYIGYTATFRAKSINDDVSFNTYTFGTVANTSYPELTPFLWQLVTCSLLDTKAVTKINTFGLTLTNEFMPDDSAFQNSHIKTRDYVCSSSGQLTAEWIYETDDDDQVYDNLFSQTTNTDVITLVTSAHTWAITTEGQYQDYSKPDKEKCLYAGNFTKALFGDGSNTALSIVRTAI